MADPNHDNLRIDLTNDWDEEADYEPNYVGGAFGYEVFPEPDLAGAMLDEFRDLDAVDLEDLTNLTTLQDIPDIDVPPEAVSPAPRPANSNEDVLTEDECLQMVLGILPEIAIDHVRSLISEKTRNHRRTAVVCERLITELLDGGPYPKERDVAERKRKREGGTDDDDDGEKEFEKNERDRDYYQDALNLLKDEFLEVPVRHIENTLRDQRSLYRSFTTLKAQLLTYDNRTALFSKIGRARVSRGFADHLATSSSKSIVKELEAAVKKDIRQMAKRRKAMDAKNAEEENLRAATESGEMAECQCCFDDFPLNRMTCCDGDTIHFFCRSCTKGYVETEIGNLKCRPVCFGDSTCGGLFSRQHLLDSVGPKTFERLENLQQQEDLTAAGLDDILDECPFCDYKAECPPIEEDKEFRCKAPRCGMRSCRLCKKESHLPQSCKDAEKDKNLDAKHAVEEAKTKALIRNCNRCKNPFIKELGCNKMTCSKCGNLQCYVCRKNVHGYEHFEEGYSGKKCPMYDHQEDRHEREVEEAEKEALRRIRAERPDITEEELKTKVSDRVKQDEAIRKQRGQNHYGMPGPIPLGPPPLGRQAMFDVHYGAPFFAGDPFRAQPPRQMAPFQPMPAPDPFFAAPRAPRLPVQQNEHANMERLARLERREAALPLLPIHIPRLLAEGGFPFDGGAAPQHENRAPRGFQQIPPPPVRERRRY